MRLKDKRFSVPFCVLEEEFDDKALLLLIFLFSRSDCSGKVTIGYGEMLKGVNIVSRNTLSKHLKALRAAGWFDYVRKRGWKPSTFFLCIPDRYQRYAPRKNIVYLKYKAKKAAAQ